jgi:hypothetical protein
MLSTLRALLYADRRDDPRLTVVVGALQRHGVPFTIIGELPWRGFGHRLLAIAQAAETLDAEVVLSCDAYDTLVLAGPTALLARFRALGAPWVHAAEPNIWPIGSHRPEEYPDHSTPWPYVNGGMYMVERAYFVDCMRLFRAELELLDHMDDQGWLATCYLRHPDLIYLDTHCQLLQCLIGGWGHFQIADGKLHNITTDTWPLVVHHNGGGDFGKDARTWPLWKV